MKNEAAMVGIDPETVEKKCEVNGEHEPIWNSGSTIFPGNISPSYFGNAICLHCGVELVATWSAKEKS